MAFELPNGRQSNTELTKLLNANCFLAKPVTIQFYSFGGKGGQSDILLMKTKGKTNERFSNYPFYFLEKQVKIFIFEIFH